MKEKCLTYKMTGRIEVSGKLLHLVASSIKISSGSILPNFPNPPLLKNVLSTFLGSINYN